MVAVRNGGVTAVRRVDVTGGNFVRAVTGSAWRGIGGADGDDMFIHMRAVGVMQMTAVKIIGVTVVLDGEVAAARAMLMLVGLGVFGVRGATAGDERERDEQKQDFFHGLFGLNETMPAANKVRGGQTSRGFASDLQISPLPPRTDFAELKLRK